MSSSVPQQQQPQHATFDLLSMPEPWIQSFLTSVDGQAKVALLQTCKALKSRLLHSQRARLDITLKKSCLHADAVQRQQVVLEQAASIKLHARGKEEDADMLLSRLLNLHMALQGSLLCNITAVRLQDCRLSEVVPTSLVAACPNMKMLELHMCSIAPELPGKEALTLPVCRQLTSLILDMGTYGHTLQRACKMLPNLTYLQARLSWDSSLGKGLLPLSLHLKHIHIDSEYLSALHFLQQFLHLTCIELPITTVKNSHMEVLLGLPKLKHVTVFGMQLESSLHHHSCCWEYLHVKFCCISALAHLPVAGIQRMDVYRIALCNKDTQTHAAGAAVNVARCAGLYTKGGVLSLDAAGSKDDTLCMTALPLLQHVRGCRHLEFCNIKGISPSFVDRLARHIPLSCMFLRFFRCTWLKKSWSMLQPSLPGFVREIKDTATCGRRREVLRGDILNDPRQVVGRLLIKSSTSE